MGCDIHLAVEVRNGDGVWRRALPPEEVRDPWLVEQAEERPDDPYYAKRVEVTWFDDRNYNLFAILAGVRNNFDFEPIAEPRGLPDDLSAEVKRLDYAEQEDEDADDNDVSLGDHSQSWLTLAELQAYNWNREVKEGGWVDPINFLLWQNEGRPQSWSSGVGGGAVDHLSWREMKRYIEDGYITFNSDGKSYTGVFDNIGGPRRYYAYVEWPLTYEQAAGRFYKQIMPALAQLGAPEDVRIVFGFDS